jgi:hypothetical protein
MGEVSDAWKDLAKDYPKLKELGDLSKICKSFDDAAEELWKSVAELEKSAKKIIEGTKSYDDFFKVKENAKAKQAIAYLFQLAAMTPSSESKTLGSLEKKLEGAKP